MCIRDSLCFVLYRIYLFRTAAPLSFDLGIDEIQLDSFLFDLSDANLCIFTANRIFCCHQRACIDTQGDFNHYLRNPVWTSHADTVLFCYPTTEIQDFDATA